jgi:hypothetical protein
MRTFISAVTAFIFLFHFSANAQKSDKEILTEINAQFIKNYINNDTISHTKIIHPKFRCITSSGQWQSRKQYMKEWLNGYTPDIKDYGYDEVSITQFGNMALVSAKTHWTLKNGNKGGNLYTDVYVKEKGQWLCVQAQLTSVK